MGKSKTGVTDTGVVVGGAERMLSKGNGIIELEEEKLERSGRKR